MQLALAIEKTKQQQKQLEDKDVEKAKAEQVAYDAGTTKTSQSLTAQLKDVARAFCAEVWSEAFNAAGVIVDSELRSANRVYYPPTLCLVSNTTPAPPNPSSTSSVPKSSLTSTTMPAYGKDKEQPTPMSTVELESEEVVEVEQLKWKKKDKEKRVIA